MKDNSSGSKKKSNKNKNPLAQARGKQNRAENIWFRRSGGGYRLFIEYYSSQPVGVVVDDKKEELVDEAVLSKSATVGSNKRLPIRQQGGGGGGQGQSRAAKRRKKKKSKGCANNGSEQTTALIETKNEMPAANSMIPTADISESPLMKQFEKYLNDDCKGSKTQQPNLRSFIEAMSKPLPLTFRLRTHHRQQDTTSSVQQTISEEFSSIISRLSFGNGNIYIGVPGLSKERLGSISSSLKQFLVENSLNGTLARQELGSMLPVVALEQVGAMKRSSRVVDMCASPGSKTLQALEVISGRRNANSEKRINKGRIIANDILESRLSSLEEAVKRSGMSTKDTSRITYSCQDASRLILPVDTSWDCVICDVPCR